MRDFDFLPASILCPARAVSSLAIVDIFPHFKNSFFCVKLMVHLFPKIFQKFLPPTSCRAFSFQNMAAQVLNFLPVSSIFASIKVILYKTYLSSLQRLFYLCFVVVFFIDFSNKYVHQPFCSNFCANVKSASFFYKRARFFKLMKISQAYLPHN